MATETLEASLVSGLWRHSRKSSRATLHHFDGASSPAPSRVRLPSRISRPNRLSISSKVANAETVASITENGSILPASIPLSAQPVNGASGPGATIRSVMTSLVVVTTPDALLGDILEHFAHYTGLPVVDPAGHCVGMISNIDMYKKQRGRAGSVSNTPVRNVMTSPVVAVFPETPVTYAAGLMLKYKVHRLPVVDHTARVVGIVTRSDIFQPLISDDAPCDRFRLVP